MILIFSPFKRFAEEQKAKKKLFQKQSQKEVPETEELPADLLEQAALEFLSFSFLSLSFLLV